MHETRGKAESTVPRKGSRDGFRPLPQPPKTYSIVARIGIDPVTGQRCAFVRTIVGDPNSIEARTDEAQAIELTNLYGVCSNSPRQANGSETPAAAAALV